MNWRPEDRGAVEAFLNSEGDRSWQYLAGLDVYLRKGMRILRPNQAAMCLVIASVEAKPTGGGRFSSFLSAAEEALRDRHTPRCVFIENVTSSRWAAHLVRIGFHQVQGFAGDEIPSYFRGVEL